MKGSQLAFVFAVLAGQVSNAAPAEGFVDLLTINPSIKVEMRYATEWNFIGRVVKGYEANRCFLTKEAANALSLVQTDLQAKGLSLIVFDCYRPTRAVDEFMKWSKDGSDQKMKAIFYPDEPKEKLFERGYIAERSGHSRGSTVDLSVAKESATPAKLEKGKLRYQEESLDCRAQNNIARTGQLDMGTTADCLSVVANTKNSGVSKEAQKNRLMLLNAMAKHGFINYSKEWWHYTLHNEPYLDKYFDFVIQ